MHLAQFAEECRLQFGEFLAADFSRAWRLASIAAAVSAISSSRSAVTASREAIVIRLFSLSKTPPSTAANRSLPFSIR